MSLYDRVFCEDDHPIRGNSRGHAALRAIWDGMKHGDYIETSAERRSHDHVPPKILRQAHADGLIDYRGKIKNGGHLWYKRSPERQLGGRQNESL